MSKRYYKDYFGDEYYIFDSETISEEDFREKLDTEGYVAFQDSLTGDEVVNKLNNYEKIVNSLFEHIRTHEPLKVYEYLKKLFKK